MADTESSKRGELIRNSIVFQLKLVADGLRDLALVPISLVATVIGLLRGGDDPDREFQQVIELGRQTETWINLFGNHAPSDDSNPATSIDVLFTNVEEKLKQQYRATGLSESEQAQIDKALKAAHDDVSKQEE